MGETKEVKDATTLEELAVAIENLADEDGFIQGRTRKFIAYKMADMCRDIQNYPINMLTRNYGIREKAIQLLNKTI